MQKINFAILATFALTLAIPCPNANAQKNGLQDEQALIEILKSDAPDNEKALTCKRLAVVASKAAVPELAKLLSEERMNSWARTALEVIPGPEADEALRAALESVQGRSLVGVINSLAVRKDEQSVSSLAKYLPNDDAQVASAAAIALGRIASDEASRVLLGELAANTTERNSAIAEGCILAAESLLEAGNSAAALNIFEKVIVADVPEQRKREAIRGAILTREDGLPLLVEQLKSEDRERFWLALRTARELDSPDVTKSLIGQFESATPFRKDMILRSLAERDDSAVLPTILAAANQSSIDVRAVALEMLGRVGDESCVSTLLDNATKTDAQLAEAAMNSLEQLEDPKVNSNLVGRLKNSSDSMRQVLLELIGRRRFEATPELLEATNDANPEIRAKALTALGQTVGPAHLSELINRVVSPKHAEDTAVARKALLAAAVRMPDREACGKQLAAAMSSASIPAQSAIVEILGNVGSQSALDAIGRAGSSQHEELQDVASQVLGKWLSPDAAPVLLELAKSKANNKYRIRFLRGYIRIARQYKFPIKTRVEMCEQASKLATRDDERVLVLGILERYASLETLECAVRVAESASQSFKPKATETAMKIAEKLGGQSSEVQELLKRIGFKPVKVEILNANYGSEQNSKDVTQIVQKGVGAMPIVNLASSSFNASFGGDPAPGVQKKLIVQYKINGSKAEATFDENSVIVLPMPASRESR